MPGLRIARATGEFPLESHPKLLADTNLTDINSWEFSATDRASAEFQFDFQHEGLLVNVSSGGAYDYSLQLFQGVPIHSVIGVKCHIL